MLLLLLTFLCVAFGSVHAQVVTIGFNGTYSVREDAGGVSIFVFASMSNLTRDVMVTLSTLDNTARAGMDYASVSRCLTFNSAVTTQAVEVYIIDDHIVEHSEIINLTLTSTDPAVILNPSNSTITIEDVDMVVIGFSGTGCSTSRTYVNEDAGSISIRLFVQNGVLDRDVIVTPSTVNGSALTGIDYDAVTANLTFNVSMPAQVVTIPILDDPIVENDESFQVTLTTFDTAVTLRSQTASVTIRDNDRVTIGFNITEYSVSEGAGSVSAVVSVLNGTLARDVSVRVLTSDDSTTSEGQVKLLNRTKLLYSDVISTPFSELQYVKDVSDYTAVDTRSVVFNGAFRSQMVTVSIRDDMIVENQFERFFINLRNYWYDSAVILGQPTASVSIEDNDMVTIGFNGIYSVNEDTGSIRIVVLVLMNCLARDVVVTLSTLDNTARTGMDYTSVSRNLTFNADFTTHVVEVPITDDHTVEHSEIINLTLRSTDSAVILNPSTSTITIEDVDMVTIGFSRTAYTVSEDVASVSVTVSVQTGTLERDIIVTLSTVNGSALSGIDYEAVTTDLTFNDSMSAQVVAIPVLDDLIVENSKSFHVILTTVDTAVTPRSQTANVTIRDNDRVTVGFNITEYSVSESAGSVSATVSVLNGTLARGVSVRVVTSDDSATSEGQMQLLNQTKLLSSAVISAPFSELYYVKNLSDYTAVDRSLVFNGATRSQVVTVSIRDDLIVENQLERLFINLRNYWYESAVILSRPTASVTIEDNDMVRIGFDRFYSVREDADSINVIVLVLMNCLARDVKVTLSTLDDTARAGIDYTPVSRNLTFNADLTIQVVEVPIIDDHIVEHSEIINLTLVSTDSAVILNPSTSTITIEDVDMVTIGFNKTAYSVSEDAVSAIVTLSVQTGTLDRDVIVTLSTINDTAMSGEEYTAVSTNVTFNASTPTQTVNISILDNEIVTGSTMLSVSLTSADPAAILNPASADITIEDDDMVTIGFNGTYSLHEGTGSINVCVFVVMNLLARDVEVRLSTLDDTARARMDYVPVSRSMIIFNANVTTQVVEVFIIDDDIVEHSEIINLTLRSIDSAVILNPSISTITIEDMDMVTIGFSRTAYTVREDAGSVSVTVSVQTGNLDRDVIVTLSTVNGSAMSGIDCEAVTTNLTFNVSIPTQVVTIPILNDPIVENDEYFHVTLTTFDTAVTLRSQTARVTIRDNDRVTIGFNITAYSVNEGAGSVSAIVYILSGTLARDIRVTVFTSTNSAASSDYGTIYRYPVFNGATRSQTVTVSIRDDMVVENQFEQFFINLRYYWYESAVIFSRPARVTIEDNDMVTIGFNGTYCVDEASGSISIVVLVMMNSLARDVVVILSTLNDTARAGIDYTPVSRSLIFNAAVTTQVVEVPIVDDHIVEQSEIINLTLVSTDPAVILNPSTTTVTIKDVDMVTIGFNKTAYSVSEDAGSVSVTLSVQTGILDKDVIVTLSTINSTAISGEEYTPVSTNVTFNASTPTQTVNITILDNEIVAGSTMFSVSLTSADPAAILNPASADITIEDDDMIRNGFNPATYTVAESAGSVNVTVNILNGTLDRGVHVLLMTALTDGTATATVDYIVTSSDLVFNTTTSSQTVTIPILEDNLFEGSETIIVILTSADPAAIVNPQSASVIIEDNDAVTIGFNPTTYSVSEDVGSVTVAVSLLSGILSRDVIVSLHTMNNTAIAGMDFPNASLDLTFNPSSTTQTVMVSILNDAVPEDMFEYFSLVLMATEPAVSLNPVIANITILEDSDMVTIGFDPVTYSVLEDAGSVNVTVSILNGTLARNVVVTLLVSGGTATAGTDYTDVTITLTFDAIIITQTVTVSILDDSVVEDTEFINLALTSVDNAAMLSSASARINIEDVDMITIGFSGTYHVHEDAGHISITVLVLMNSLARDVVVTLSTLDDTTRAGMDYIPVSRSLTFNAAVTTQMVEVSIIDDHIVEHSEIINLTLGSTNPAVILNPSTSTITIEDVDMVTIGFNTAAYTLLEDAGSVNITASILNGTLARNGVVTLSTESDGTATAGIDYIDTTITLMFDATILTQMVTVLVLDDNVVEDAEFINLALRSMDNAVILNPATARINIEDINMVTIGLNETYSVHEDAGVIGIVVLVLTNSLARNVAVTLTTLDDTARAGTDYTSLSRNLTFNVTVTTQMVEVPIIDDHIVENSEVINLILVSTDSAVILNPSTSTITIEDVDMVTIGFNSTAYTVSEDAASVSVTVSTQSGALNRDVIVTLSTINGTAMTGEEYTPVSTNVTFKASTSNHTVNIPILDNEIVAGSSVFSVSLTSADPAAILNPASADITIEDDDTITIGFNPATYTMAESASRVNITVNVLNGTLARDVHVFLMTSLNDSTATAMVDYTVTSSDLTFDAATSSPTVTIPIHEDNIVEGSEVIIVTLTSADSAAILNPSSASVTIEDNDGVTIGFIPTTYSVHEDEGSVTVAVSVLTGTLGRDVIVSLMTMNGTAVAGMDFSNISLDLTFSPSSTTQTVMVSILNDHVPEDILEYFSLVLISTDPAVLLNPVIANITIIDDSDVVTIGFNTVANSVLEDASSVSITVSILNGTLAKDVVVTLSTESDGTATAGTDYTDTTVTLTFDATILTQMVIVSILDDSVVEDTEFINLALTSEDNAVILNPPTARIDIEDIDMVTIGFNGTYSVREDVGGISIVLFALMNSLAKDAVVTLSTLDDTARAGMDYTPVSRDLTFNAAVTTQIVEVPIIDDDIVEHSEIINLTLVSTDSAVILNPSTSTITIEDVNMVTIGFNKTAYSVSEDADSVTITLSVQIGAQDRDVVITLSSINGTAMSGEEFTPVSTNVTFDASTPNQRVNIPILDNGIVAGSTMFSVSLTSADPAAILNPASADITIEDDDTIKIGFNPSTYTVVESAGSVIVTVNILNGTLARDVRVLLMTALTSLTNGTATATVDYTVTSSDWTFNATTSSQTVTIPILEDDIVEDSETIIVTLTSTDSAAIVNPSSASVTIEDNDEVTIGFNPTTYSVTEDVGSVSVAVSLLSGILGRDVIVSLRTTNGTAVAGMDFLNTSLDLTFSSSSTTQTVMVPILNDAVTEDMLEHFSLVLMSNDPAVSLNPIIASITIVDDSDVVTIGFDAVAYSVLEDAVSVNVTVSILNGTLARNVVVILSTELGGTATAGTDYTDVTITLMFDATISTQMVTVPIVDDNVVEDTEFINLALTSVDNAVIINPPTARIDIEDVDMVTIGFNRTYSVREDVGGISIVVVALTNSLTRDVVVTLSTLDDTARAGMDYTPVSRSLTFNAATTTQMVEVPITDDHTVEQSEIINLTLVSADSAVILNPSTSTITIEDADMVTIGFNETAYSVREDASNVSIALSVHIGVLDRDVVVTLSSINGTATSGEEYTPVSSNVTFNATTSTQTINISILDNEIVAGSTMFSVSLTSADPAAILNPASADITIEDEDMITIGFNPATYTVAESAGSVNVTVNILNGTLDRGVHVLLITALTDGTATATVDYAVTNSDLAFNTTTSSQTVTIPILEDNIFEGSETIIVTLTSADPAAIVNPSRASVTIEDNDGVTVGFNPTTYSVLEDRSSVSVAVFLISGILARDVIVSLQALNGTAFAGMDFPNTSLDLTINPSSTTQTVMVSILNDAVTEDMLEYFSLVLMSTDSAVSLNPMIANITIIDDNDMVTVGFNTVNHSVLEDAGSVNVTVSILNGTLARNVVVTLSPLSGGTAIAGTDYIYATITLRFDATILTQMVTVLVLDDNVVEDTEFINLALTSVDSAVMLNPAAVRINIEDIDMVTIGFSSVNYSVLEDAGIVHVSVFIMNGTLARDVVVTLLTVSGGTATAGTDYIDANITLMFGATISTQMVTVPVLNDNVVEDTEFINLALTSVDSAVMFNPATARISIEDVDNTGSNTEYTCTTRGEGTLTFTWTMTTPVSLPSSVQTQFNPRHGSETSSQASHDGVYMCSAGNDTETVDPRQATLTVIEISDIPDRTVILGTNATFTCNAVGPGDIFYHWNRTVFDANGALMEIGFYNESRVSGEDTSTLMIIDVGVRDEGHYTCFISINGTTRGDSTAILDTQGLIILEQPTSTNLLLGSDLILKCTAQNNAPNELEFYWYQNGHSITPSSHVMINSTGENATQVASSELAVMQVTDSDSGVYQCTATNRDIVDGVNATADVTVLFMPVLHFISGVVRRDVTTSLLVECTVEAVPPVTFVEIRRRDEEGDVVLSAMSGNSQMLTLQYTLGNLMVNDSGVYVCVANNSIGTKEQNVTLVVQAPPGEVNHSLVTRELLTLQSVRLTWVQPKDNNGHITSYNLTYCAMHNRFCMQQTRNQTFSTNEMAIFSWLIPLRTYQVYIRAVNDVGQGPEPAEPYFFESVTQVEAQVVGLNVVFVSATSVVLAWQLPTIAESADINFFLLSYNLQGVDTTHTDGVTRMVPYQQARTPGVTVSSLNSDALYEFQVSVNYSDPVLLSAETSIMVHTNQSDFTPPNNVGVPPVVQQHFIIVTWPPPTGEEFVTNYILMYTSVNMADQQITRGNITISSTQISYNFTSPLLQPYSNYTFVVFADFGDGEMTQVVSPLRAVSQEAAPSPPVDLQVQSIFYISLNLIWSAPLQPNGNIIQYTVYYQSVSSNIKRSVIAQDYIPGSIYTLEGLSPNTVYNICVTASTSEGEGNCARVAEVTKFGVYPPEIASVNPTTEQNTYRMTINPFNTTYGPLSHYKIVLVHGSNTSNTKTEIPDNKLRPGSQSNTSYHVAAAFMVEDFQNTFLIGDGQNYMLNDKTFKNVPLNVDKEYSVFIRLYSNLQSNVFEDSLLETLATAPTTSYISTSSPAVIIVVGIGGTLIFILITVIVICLKRRCLSQKRIAPDPADLTRLQPTCQGTTSSSRSRRVHHPNPDPTVMEEWEREMGREESELIMDESRV